MHRKFEVERLREPSEDWIERPSNNGDIPEEEDEDEAEMKHLSQAI